MRSTSLRWGALLAAGVLAVHEIRFRVLAADVGAAASSAGHGYLGALTATVGVAFLLALGRYLQLWLDRQADHGGASLGPLRRWALASGAVLAGYVGQELLAGWLAAGHPVGIGGLLAHGGWIALPLSLVAGGLISFVVGTTTEALVRRGKAVAVPVVQAVELRRFSTPEVMFVWGREVARNLAGRSPPPLLSR